MVEEKAGDEFAACAGAGLVEDGLELLPRMTMVVLKKLETDGLALTHGRWQLVVTEDGCEASLGGIGTMVSRRHPDGTWGIVLDDPLTGT